MRRLLLALIACAAWPLRAQMDMQHSMKMNEGPLGMLSVEPWTIGSRGYPLLLQSGESYRGAMLHDRQHPHDVLMELATLYERPVARNLGLSLYLAPVGEPAVGPVAFPHRPLVQ